METVISVLLGAVASLIASLVWWLLSQLYAIDTKKKVNSKIVLLRDVNFSFEKHLQYNNYDLAIEQAGKILEIIDSVCSMIKPLTYSAKKRKLIFTFLSSMYCNVSLFLRDSRGYEGETEKEVCCQRALGHINVVGFDMLNGEQRESCLKVLIDTMSDLNLYKGYKKALRQSFCFNGNPTLDERKQYYKDAVNIQSFKGSFSKDIATEYQITVDTLTQKEFNKLINKL